MQAWARFVAEQRFCTILPSPQAALASVAMFSGLVPGSCSQISRLHAAAASTTAPGAAPRCGNTTNRMHATAKSVPSPVYSLRSSYARLSLGDSKTGTSLMQWQSQHAYSSTPLTDAGSATPSVSLAALDAGVQPQQPNGAQRPEHRLRTSEGLDTTIVYGFLKILLALMEQAPPPTHLAVVFDSGSGSLKGKTFRHEIYAGYKGHRQRMPEEIAWALPPLVLLLEQMRIPTFKVPGLEADDIIATLAVRSVDAGFHVEIASPDKDFNQILRPGLELLRPATSKTKKGETFNRFNCDSFREAFDLEPHQFADVLALMGDASDNVPGVKGVGEKISIALLKEYGDLDNVLANADKVSRKQVRETLLSDDGIAAARLSSRLVKLQTDIDVPDLRVPLDTMRLQLPDEVNRKNALGLLQELELKTHADRLRALYDGAVQA